MAFADLVAEVKGSVPKIPISLCPTLVNRSFRDIRRRHLWSFNLLEWAWITPPPVTTGGCTFNQGSNLITFDATAMAAIAAFQVANPYVLVTQLQVRSGNVAGLSGIYNIIAYNATSGVATLDRIYADASGADVSYTLYQVYYVPPVKDFRALMSVRNMQMFLDLNLTMTRAQLDARDPQRSFYAFPTHVVPFGRDQRGAGTATPSATLDFPMYEFWGQPVSPFTYHCYGIRDGVDLVNPTDTLPFAISDDTVMQLAKYYAYEWAEANKNIVPKAVGPDYRFLMGDTLDQYGKFLSRDRRQDKELVDNYFQLRDPDWASKAFGWFNTIAGIAAPYAPL